VAVLSGNDPVAFACVFGCRAPRRVVPDQPAQRGGENRFVLDAFDCSCLIFHSNYAPLVEQMRADLPK
jgi:fatty-acyl-CoA synthase